MTQRLPIVIAWAKAGTTSENLFTKRNKTNHIFLVSSKRNH